MKRMKTIVIAILALAGMVAVTPIATAAPTEQDAAKLEAEVGLTTEQQTKVNTLLDEMKSKRREIKDDSSLSREQQRAKTKVVNDEYLAKGGKINALMTDAQFAKWTEAQKVRRAARDAAKAANAGQSGE